MALNTDQTLKQNMIYQIFTRNYKDGTFNAVKDDLDRIQHLGVDIIYLLPIQPSGSVNRKGTAGSPYAIKDYRAVDPSQGTMEEFIALCDAVHQRGMRIIIDVVYNHTSPDSVLANEHPEWFYHKEDGTPGNRFGEWWDVIDLDYSYPELWQYQIDTLKMWARYVDGFRCDVAPMVPLEFWRKAKEEVATVRPECMWLAESVDPQFIRAARKSGFTAHSDSELYQVFDICYDYDIYHSFLNALMDPKGLADYLRNVNEQETIYPQSAIKLRFLENHDRNRAAALIQNEAALHSWLAWICFVKGCVMIYAGQEFCNTHHPTLFDVDPVDFNTGKDISSCIRKLSDIRRNDLFTTCITTARTAGTSHSVIIAENQSTADPGKKAIGIFPVDGAAQPVTVDLPDGKYIDAISGKEVEVFEEIMITDGEPVILFL